jgi:hypothetical protein
MLVSDRTCEDINECANEGSIMHNCHENADCNNTDGSFSCECKIQWLNGREYFGDGLDVERAESGGARGCNQCRTCTKGEYMLDQCTSTSDRECRPNILDGNYAIETEAGSTKQCLVHWKEAGKVFPERYSWGGRDGLQSEGGDTAKLRQMGQHANADGGAISPGPDYCKNPVCGVCDYGGVDPKELLVAGGEAVWALRNVPVTNNEGVEEISDLYLILNGADALGYRCLGFERPDAPYPTFLTWTTTEVQEAEGRCERPFISEPRWMESRCEGGTATGTESTAAACTAKGGTFYPATCDSSDPRDHGKTETECQWPSCTSADACQTGPMMRNKCVNTTTKKVQTKDLQNQTAAQCSAGYTIQSIDMAPGKGACFSGSDLTTIPKATCLSMGAPLVWIDEAACLKDDYELGEWSTEVAGVRTLREVDGYACGMEGDQKWTQLVANGGTVWNIKPLGCSHDEEAGENPRRWHCDANRQYGQKYMIRSLAGGDIQADGVVDEKDYQCLYFPYDGAAYSHPRRTPASPSEDGVWLGATSNDVDGTGDPECGIMPEVDEEGNVAGTQEVALITNKQAVFTLIPLPVGGGGV